jgi:NAD-dependent dihydropyrimidine dehydrogenase PreA subunit
LTLIAEEPRVIARRGRIPVAEAARQLEAMDRKGLIFGTPRPGKPAQYRIAQFVVGFWEGQVNHLDRELARDFEEYLPALVDLGVWRKAPQLRTIPVSRSLSYRTEVMSYEQAEVLLRGQTTIGLMNCICRQQQHLLDKGCAKPPESCLAFGMAAEHGIRLGRARPIGSEEALDVLRRAEQAGLVLQPANARAPLFLCTCCGCCCAVLRSLKRHAKPATVVASAFMAKLDAGACKGCGACVERCQMEALRVSDGVAVLNQDRCIGCGLCVTTCPAHALSLSRKEAGSQPAVPRDILETSMKLGRARGKLGLGVLVQMQARSKLDRLLAPR